MLNALLSLLLNPFRNLCLMSKLCTPSFLFAFTVALLAVVIGCSHAVQIDVPTGYTGKVTVLCDRFADVARPIAVGADGVARQATCPRSRQSITVVRDGKAIPTVGDPHWTTTGDGIVLAVEFDVR